MLIGLTGTPGTGKTSVSMLLEKKRGWEVIHLNELIKEKHFYDEVDEKRDAVIADLELVQAYLGESISEDEKIRIIESHLSHYLVDTAIILRTHPHELKIRLKSRNYSEEKIKENIEAEALDVILVEAFEWCEKVYEINTTGKGIEEVEKDVEKIIDCILSKKEAELGEYEPGSINWIDLVP